jgi:hypothetical protein
MTDKQSLIFFVIMGYGIVACLGDYITTLKGFDKGLVEANPVSRWLQAKLGYAPAAFAAIALYIVSTTLIAEFVNTTLGFVIAAGIAGLETVNTVRNYILARGK